MRACKPGICLVLILSLLVGCSQKQSLDWIAFHWVGDTISGKYVEKAFIYVPVRIDSLPQDFTMQLDLGMDQTVFYGNTIDTYTEAYTSLSDKYDIPMFRDVNLRMGKVGFKGVDVGYYANFGEKIPKDSLQSNTPKHIGTMATDLFKDKVLVIDYKSSRFAVTDTLPAEYKDLPAEGFELREGFVIIPFLINGKECKLMFDTGSSPFQLVTTKERALEISNSAIVDSLSGPLWWGKEITFYGLDVNKPIEFGGKVLDNSRVFYDKDGLWDKMYHSLNIWGITGNAYFLESVMIIDYKNKLIRFVKSSF